MRSSWSGVLSDCQEGDLFMSDPTRQQLQQAYELIKGKQRQQALEILLPILQADENNVNAWWLLANAVTEPNDAREALENVLRLRPDHANARKMLDDLNRRYPPPPPQAEDGFDFGAPSGDIFAAAEASLPPAASSDPFGAPAQPFGGPAQPFGAPSGSSGSKSRTPAESKCRASSGSMQSNPASISRGMNRRTSPSQ
jgi:tetratricopeptide (TPR) repeat protein